MWFIFYKYLRNFISHRFCLNRDNLPWPNLRSVYNVTYKYFNFFFVYKIWQPSECCSVSSRMDAWCESSSTYPQGHWLTRNSQIAFHTNNVLFKIKPLLNYVHFIYSSDYASPCLFFITNKRNRKCNIQRWESIGNL